MLTPGELSPIRGADEPRVTPPLGETSPASSATTFSSDAPAHGHPHPLVALDDRVRVPAMFIMALIAVAHFHERPHGPALWIAIAFTELAWPHLAYLLASKARDSKRAELAKFAFRFSSGRDRGARCCRISVPGACPSPRPSHSRRERGGNRR